MLYNIDHNEMHIVYSSSIRRLFSFSNVSSANLIFLFRHEACNHGTSLLEITDKKKSLATIASSTRQRVFRFKCLECRYEYVEEDDFKRHVINKHHLLHGGNVLVNQTKLVFDFKGKCVVCRNPGIDHSIHFYCHICDIYHVDYKIMADHMETHGIRLQKFSLDETPVSGKSVKNENKKKKKK